MLATHPVEKHVSSYAGESSENKKLHKNNFIFKAFIILCVGHVLLVNTAVAPPTSFDLFQVSDKVFLTCPPAGSEGPG